MLGGFMGIPVLLLQLGEAPEPVRLRHGAFPTWYERVWGGPLTIHDGRAGGRGPEVRDFAGVIVTGSSASLTEVSPWMEDAAALVVHARDVGVPVLGVCFGHQLLGHAFGGRVVRNPAGWELGSFDVTLTDEGRADWLLEGLPPVARVNLVHQDMVVPGPGTRVLGSSERTPVQVLAVGEHVRGVQFHPEITGEILRGYIDARRSLLTHDDPDVLLARAADSPHGEAVLRSFKKRCGRS
jgi:GMP synthase (glutamine-hydrolysing)